MSKPRRKKTSATKVYPHKEPRESFHYPEALKRVLEQYVEQSHPKTSKTAVIVAALEEFFERAGLWPPADPS